jgi:spermidine synthase
LCLIPVCGAQEFFAAVEKVLKTDGICTVVTDNLWLVHLTHIYRKICHPCSVIATIVMNYWCIAGTVV